MRLTHSNLVWSTDITSVPMAVGFLYLVAALAEQQPCVFNTDQGAQFTSAEFTGRLKEKQIMISMDGRGRALENAFIERLWRTIKFEDIYWRDDQSVPDLIAGLTAYLQFYNHERPHSALQGMTPAEVHWASLSTVH